VTAHPTQGRAWAREEDARVWAAVEEEVATKAVVQVVQAVAVQGGAAAGIEDLWAGAVAVVAVGGGTNAQVCLPAHLGTGVTWGCRWVALWDARNTIATCATATCATIAGTATCATTAGTATCAITAATATCATGTAACTSPRRRRTRWTGRRVRWASCRHLKQDERRCRVYLVGVAVEAGKVCMDKRSEVGEAEEEEAQEWEGEEVVGMLVPATALD